MSSPSELGGGRRGGVSLRERYNNLRAELWVERQEKTTKRMDTKAKNQQMLKMAWDSMQRKREIDAEKTQAEYTNAKREAEKTQAAYTNEKREAEAHRTQRLRQEALAEHHAEEFLQHMKQRKAAKRKAAKQEESDKIAKAEAAVQVIREYQYGQRWLRSVRRDSQLPKRKMTSDDKQKRASTKDKNETGEKSKSRKEMGKPSKSKTHKSRKGRKEKSKKGDKQRRASCHRDERPATGPATETKDQLDHEGATETKAKTVKERLEALMVARGI